MCAAPWSLKVLKNSQAYRVIHADLLQRNLADKVAERGDTPPHERSHGDRNREGRSTERDRGDHDRSPSGDFDRDSRRNRDDMTKDETEAYEQLAADVKLESGIRRVNADIFELMGKNLTPSTKA